MREYELTVVYDLAVEQIADVVARGLGRRDIRAVAAPVALRQANEWIERLQSRVLPMARSTCLCSLQGPGQVELLNAL